MQKSEVPAELITASGSGLDPDLSPKAALVQVERISKLRNISQEKLVDLVNSQTQKPLLWLMGTARVNVLQLNIALDNLQ